MIRFGLFTIVMLFVFAGYCQPKAKSKMKFYALKDTSKVVFADGFYEVMPDLGNDSGFQPINNTTRYFIGNKPVVPINMFAKVEKRYEQVANSFVLDFTLTNKGGALMAAFSQRNVGKGIGLFVNKKLISVATISSAIIRGRLSLSGNFTYQECEMLEKRLKLAISNAKSAL